MVSICLLRHAVHPHHAPTGQAQLCLGQQAGRGEFQAHQVGFRNIAVHDYQSLQLPITVAIIEKHLDEFLQYSKALLQHDAG